MEEQRCKNNADLDFSVLSEEEQAALLSWLDRGRPPIAVSTAAKLFEIFMQGQTCKQIHKLNPQFDYGAILHARMRDGWDKMRSEYVAETYGRVRQRVIQTQLEAVDYIANQLAATHKYGNERFLKYLQTGNPEDLEGVPLAISTKSYKETVETLQKLTGQDKRPENNPVNVVIQNGGAGPASAQIVEVQPMKQLDGAGAAVIIRKALEAAKKEKA